jgi:hypothetical protein
MKVTEEKLNKAIDILKKDISENLSIIMKNSVGVLLEAVDDTNDYDEAIKRLEAAKRAIGILNRFPSGPYKKKHASRIFTNLNHLRRLVLKMQSQLTQEITGDSSDIQQVA